MIRYYCKDCNIDCGTSECPVCGTRTESESKIYWCHHCNIPIYDEECSVCGEIGKYITTDIRPVFPEERLLLEILLGEPLKYINNSVWNGVGNRYIVDGKKIKVSIAKLMEKNSLEVIRLLEKYKPLNSYDNFNNIVKKFVNANSKRFNHITTEATEFVKQAIQGYGLDETFVSFSGGKDSTVVSDLVVKAISDPTIIHIFGDTTLEFPLTMEYVKRFKANNRHTPMLPAKNRDKNFYEMCELVGPPSRVMRWCCIIFKTGAITKKINGVFRNKKKLITFYGIRRSESASRSKYDRETDSPKITKQKVISPIIDWFDFDIWLYLLTTEIDFNDAYRLGYSRVGCWCCPNNSKWSQYLSSIYMPEEYKKWNEFLITFAKRIGKPDAEVYVAEGKWKARQGGNGVEISKNTFVEFKPCVVEDNTFNYELKRKITEQLYEFFKPFGWISKEMGNERLGEVYIVDRNNTPILKLQGRVGTNLLKVSILKKSLLGSKNIREARQKVECQLTKYQMCVGCLACESVCKHDAVSVREYSKTKVNLDVAICSEKDDNSLDMHNIVYNIDDKKCLRCGACVNHFDGGCYMRKVLITKRGE